MSRARDGDLVHAHGRDGAIVAIGACFFNLFDHIHTFDHATKDRMFRVSGGEPIKKVVVHRIDEELARSAITLAGVGHRERSRFVRYLGVFRVFVLYRAVRTIPRTSQSALRIAAVRTAKLNHEVVDDPMKVQPIVKAAFHERDEVLGGDGHPVEVQLDLEVAEGRFAKCGRVCHGRAA